MNGGNGPLRVLLQILRAQDAGDPYAFRFEPQDYILPTHGGDSPSARFNWTPDVLADLQAARLPGRDPSVVQRLGDVLFRFVQKAGWEQHEHEIAKALAEHRQIIVTIRSSAAEMYALPWELLTLKSGQFVGEVERILLRFEWPESQSAQEHPKPRPEGGRILVAWSAAGGAVPAEAHIQAIASASATGFHAFNSDTDVLVNASVGRIATTLEQAQKAGPPIAVLHLLCHGGVAGSTFGLCLDGADGPVVVDAAQLREQLTPFASMVRLVVLSACDSGNGGTFGNRLGSVAQTLHRCGFASVIASRYPLSIAGSVLLAESFYRELLTGPASLETALLTARKRLARCETDLPREHRHLEWASVQLYARHEDGDDSRPVVFRPFRGLLAFQPEHRRFFFGRDKEVQQILTVLQALIDHKKERLVVVAGASGTGKSSLVFAGAVPKLLENNPQLAFLRMRPGKDPDKALNAALGACPAATQALLVVDQFEEIFTQTEAPAAREAFVRRLWSLAADPDSGLRIIITLRVDFIGRCGELAVNEAGRRLDRVAYDERHRVFVAQLEGELLRTAIVEPVHKVGLELQAGLSDRMLLDVGNEPGALPLLADVLDVLWQHRQERMLTQTTYDALGGVVGALQRRADAVIGKLSKADLDIAQRLLVSLVAVADDTTQDTRLRVALADLQQSFSRASAVGFDRVLKEMVSARLLVQDGNEETSHVEMAHEALIRKWPKLRAWLDEDRAGLLMQRRVKQAAQEWAHQDHDESLLYRGVRLSQALEWRQAWESRLRDVERQFLDASDALRVRQETEAAERQRLEQEREAAEQLAQEHLRQEQQRREAAQTLARWTRLAALLFGLLFLGAVGAGLQAYRRSVESKQKSIEHHDNLLVAVARASQDDPTKVATILREAGHQPHLSTRWIQAASEALQYGIAERILRGHQADVTWVAFHPDGTKLFAGSQDRTVRVWNADGTGLPVVTKGPEDKTPDDRTRPSVDASPKGVFAFSPDGKKMAINAPDNTVLVWNAEAPGSPVLLRGFKASVTVVAFSPDGHRIAAGTQDGSAQLWNADGSAQPTIIGAGNVGSVNALSFSPNGNMIAACYQNGSTILWNTDGSILTTIPYTTAPTSVAFSPDGKNFVRGFQDGTVWIKNTKEIEGRRGEGHVASITSIAFSPDGRLFATGSRDKTARIWDVNSGGMLRILKGHNAFVNSVSFSPDGRKVVTGSSDKTVRMWDVNGTAKVLGGHKEDVTSIAFSPDGRQVVTGSMDHTARVWNVGSSLPPVIIKEPAGASFFGCSVGPAYGKGLMLPREPPIWSSDVQFMELKGHQEGIWSVAFSPDGKRIATASFDHTVRIWNTDGTGTPIVLHGHEGPVQWAAFSPDGQKIVTVSNDQTARIWNADGSGAPSTLKGHAGQVFMAAFSPDGKKVVTGSADGTARVWNVDGSSVPFVLGGHLDAVTSVTFSPDGQMIATGSKDRTMRIWNAGGVGASRIFRGHQAHITSVTFSPDGTKVATSSADHTVRIWRTNGPADPLTFRVHEDGIFMVAFSPDGARIATASADRTARIWLIDEDRLRSSLWGASKDCLPTDDRRDLFLESLADAQQGYLRCQHEVAMRHGLPSQGGTAIPAQAGDSDDLVPEVEPQSLRSKK